MAKNEILSLFIFLSFHSVWSTIQPMHLPDYLLQGSVTWLTWVSSIVLLAVAAWPGTRHTHAFRPFEFASVSALIFALQMVHFSIGQGSSGHLIGGVLAASLLGIRSGMISMALVLLIQSLLFSDGGLAILGANILNMAVLATGCGGWLSRVIVRRLPANRNSWFLAPGLASSISVLAIAFACAVELAWGGAAPFLTLIGPMLLSQLPVALFEGILTCTAVWFLTLSSDDPEKSPLPVAISTRVITVMLTALFAATLISPWSSSHPAIIQKLLAALSWWHLGNSAYFGILPDYNIPDIPGGVSTSLAGLLGVFTVFMAGWLLEQVFFQILRKRHVKRSPRMFAPHST